MADGTSLRKTWYNALSDAEAHFKVLLASSSSKDWRRVAIASSTPAPIASGKGKSREGALPADVLVHRNRTGEWRAVLDIPLHNESGTNALDAYKAVLLTPELKAEWDPAVEAAQSLDLLDHATRISRTNYRLGWPANPRDAVVISRTFTDENTVIDISTSVPRSPDEPAWLRPSPPHVRSHVKLFAWCIQHVQQPSPSNATSADTPPSTPRKAAASRLRLTCFWSHDLQLLIPPTANATATQIASMLISLHRLAQQRGTRVPVLAGFGAGVSLERLRFAPDREQLVLEYAIVPDDASPKDTYDKHGETPPRTVEVRLPRTEGWDVLVSTKASRPSVAQLPYNTTAMRIPIPTSSADVSGSSPPRVVKDKEKVAFKVEHSALPDDHSVLKVKLTIELGATSGLRLNGLPQRLVDPPLVSSPTTLASVPIPTNGYAIPPSLAQEATTASNASFVASISSSPSIKSFGASTSTSIPTTSDRPVITRTDTERSAAAEKTIGVRIRRNYIYFSSLLQEPEAKWRITTAARGVEIAQLDSIDPTLIVYRAEATFVGVGLWDIVAAVTTPGARSYWDRLHADASLLSDAGPLSGLWWFRSRPAYSWPAQARDSALLQTVYRGPGAAHVFSFSVDEERLFPALPPTQPGTIRAQVDLYGWAIEALSPTTTLVTLLEQSDPKGWSGKGGTPANMIAAVAGLGEFAIRCGGPPVCSRLDGAKKRAEKYEHERGMFRLEYEAKDRTVPADKDANKEPAEKVDSPTGLIECEIRADLDQWATNLDVVVDPPPQNIAALRRHRLASAGGGLWLTLTHDAGLAAGERILVIVRRGPGSSSSASSTGSISAGSTAALGLNSPTSNNAGGPRGEKGVVMVNGARVTVDVEEMAEDDVKAAQKQPRSKPTRLPLDRPPVLGVIRKRWPGSGEDDSASPTSPRRPGLGGAWTSWIGDAMQSAGEATRDAMKAIAPPPMEPSYSHASADAESPLQPALDALAFVHAYHAAPRRDGWQLIAEKGFPVHRRNCAAVSSAVPVHRGEKVLEGVCADELVPVLSNVGCRAGWDDRYVSATPLQAFGADASTVFVVSRAGMLFRDRGFLMASLIGRTLAPPSASRRNSTLIPATPTSGTEERAAIFVVSASFAPGLADSAGLASSKYNPNAAPLGRLLLDGWILETLDPYGEESFTIPSTRVTRLVAVDYAGSVPAAVNGTINATLPKQILALETFVKSMLAPPIVRMPPAGYVVAGAPTESVERKESVWALKRSDVGRTLISSAYSADTKTYRVVVQLGIGSTYTAPKLEDDADTTPRQSRLGRRRTSDVSVPRVSTSTRRESLSGGSVPASPSSPPPTITSFSPVSPSSPASSMRFMGTARRRSTSKSLVGAAALAAAFNPRGEASKPGNGSNDWLVAELVVDSKLYPGGCKIGAGTRIRDIGAKVVPYPATPDINEPSTEGDDTLPLVASAYILPSSPLHSSGLSADKSTRHLVRFTLPTAQYQRQTLQDPLTGEMRTAPPRPKWLSRLHERGAVVDLRITPLDQGKDSGKKKSIPPMQIFFREDEVKVQSESEANTALGREELTGDRVDKMGTLSIVDDVDKETPTPTLPAELVKPLAVAQSYLETLSPFLVPTIATPVGKVEASGMERIDSAASTTTVSGATLVASEAEGGPAPTPLRSFWMSYPTAFTSRIAALAPRGPRAAASGASDSRTSDRGSGSEIGAKGDSAGSALSLVREKTRSGTGYPLAVLVLVALVAFLLGSLLRSLVSPADFVYVVTDTKAAQERIQGDPQAQGWREIRRLVELKYIVGGWDFQIAVVRRH